jgi:hypothetical protein
VSVRSLAVQGGRAGEAEVNRFLRHPLAADAMLVRRWDDEAKVPGAVTLGLDEFLDIAQAAAAERWPVSRQSRTSSIPTLELVPADRHPSS